MTRFFFPDRDFLSKTGHAGLASLPILFNTDFELLEAESRYIRERAFMEWPIREDRTLRPRDGGLSGTTIETLARRLQHFSDWRHGRERGFRRNLDELVYDDILTYEREQRLGQGAFAGRRISHRTAAMRADVATDFMSWAATRELRNKFPLVMTDRVASFSSRASAVGAGTVGRSGVGDVAALSGVPTRSEIKGWLDAVLDQRGLAKYLICRVMVETGIRLMEAVAIETWQWPTRAQLTRALAAGLEEVDLVLVVTKYSRSRTVKVPIDLAMTVAHWHEISGRPELVETYMSRRPRRAKPTRLFVSDRPNGRGIPIQRHTVYDCFIEVQPRPAGWHPHMARHAFACHFMAEALLIEVETEDAVGIERWIEHRGIVAAERLKQLLGHKQFETTRIYLDYLRMNTRFAMLADSEHDRLNGEDA